MAFTKDFEKTANMFTKLIKGMTGKAVATSTSKPLQPMRGGIKSKSPVTGSMVSVSNYSDVGLMPKNFNASGNLNKGTMNLNPKKSIMDY